MKDKIFTVVAAPRVKELFKKIASQKGNIEVRADYARDFKAEHLKQIAALKNNRKIIFTCRAKNEGGRFAGPENERVKILLSALKEKLDYVDIELAAVKKHKLKFTAAQEKKLIISYHNFNKMPSEKELIKIKNSCGGAAVKIAAYARTDKDILLLTSFLIDTIIEGRKIILIAMGRKGVFTRIFFPMLGSLATYAEDGQKTAPGQLTRKELENIWSFL